MVADHSRGYGAPHSDPKDASRGEMTNPFPRAFHHVEFILQVIYTQSLLDSYPTKYR